MRAQGPAEDPHRQRRIWRWSCATAPAACRRARSATRTLLAGRFERGDLVSVVGRVERFRDDLVVEVTDIRRRARLTATAPSRSRSSRSCRSPTATWTSSTASSSTSPRRSTTPATGRCSTRCSATPSCAPPFRRTPCTRNGHHAYLGGLLEHTVAVATLARELCDLHRRLNSDLLLTAAIVHDLGRTREFTYGAEIGLTEEGRLLGHLTLGQQLLSERFAALGEALDSRAGWRSCTACSPTTGRPACPAAASARPRRWRSTASTRSMRASRVRWSTGSGSAQD